MHSLAADEQSGPHVRPIDPRLGSLIAEGARRSPVFRSLLERLDRSTVFAYIGYGPLPAGLSGRLRLAGTAARPWRYVRIEIECRQSLDSQIVALGHELQHAVEIAEADAAVDQRSLQALYGAIGFAIDDNHREFESVAARDISRRVRRELSSRAATVAAPTAD